MHEGARVIFLVGGLREARSDMCYRCGNICLGTVAQRPFIATAGRKLEFRHGWKAITFTDTGRLGERFRQRRIELRLNPAARYIEIQSGHRTEAHFGLETRRMGIGDVEDNTRRTTAGIECHLQVADVVIEACRVECEGVTLHLHAQLVIPQRLIIIVLEAPEESYVLGVAERDIERIVYPAKAEAL